MLICCICHAGHPSNRSDLKEPFCTRIRTCIMELWPGLWPNFWEASDVSPVRAGLPPPPCLWPAQPSISDRPRSDLALWDFAPRTDSALREKNVLADHTLLLFESSFCTDILILQVLPFCFIFHWAALCDVTDNIINKNWMKEILNHTTQLIRLMKVCITLYLKHINIPGHLFLLNFCPSDMNCQMGRNSIDTKPNQIQFFQTKPNCAFSTSGSCSLGFLAIWQFNAPAIPSTPPQRFSQIFSSQSSDYSLQFKQFTVNFTRRQLFLKLFFSTVLHCFQSFQIFFSCIVSNAIVHQR